MRWDAQIVDAEAQRALPGYSEPALVRTFDAPDALDTRFYEVRAKSVLNRVPKASRMPFRWTINPYRGCSHACVFCFARPTHIFLGMDAGRDFDREIVVKVNAPEVLRAELARPSWKGEHVAMGTNTDPYQWVEGRYELMVGIWEALRDARNPCSILTKSPLVLRDVGLLREIAAVTDVSAAFSVPTIDEKAWRATEPRTPNPMARIEAIAELTRAGIPVGVLIAPLMPGINDDPRQVEKIVELVTEAGASSVNGVALHLRGEVHGIFFDWLRAQRPDLVPLYERLYARGAYAPSEERRRLTRLARPKRPLSDPPRVVRGDPGPAAGRRCGVPRCGSRSRTACSEGLTRCSGPEMHGMRASFAQVALPGPPRRARDPQGPQRFSRWAAARSAATRWPPRRRCTRIASSGATAAIAAPTRWWMGATKSSARSRSIARTTARATSRDCFVPPATRGSLTPLLANRPASAMKPGSTRDALTPVSRRSSRSDRAKPRRPNLVAEYSAPPADGDTPDTEPMKTT